MKEEVSVDTKGGFWRSLLAGIDKVFCAIMGEHFWLLMWHSPCPLPPELFSGEPKVQPRDPDALTATEDALWRELKASFRSLELSTDDLEDNHE